MTAFHSVKEGGGGHGGSGGQAEQGSSAESLSKAVEHQTNQTNQQPEVSADFYQAAVVHAGIPAVPLDVTGRILAWNAAAVRMFGWSEADVLGRLLIALIPAECRA